MEVGRLWLGVPVSASFKIVTSTAGDVLGVEENCQRGLCPIPGSSWVVKRTIAGAWSAALYPERFVYRRPVLTQHSVDVVLVGLITTRQVCSDASYTGVIRKT